LKKISNEVKIALTIVVALIVAYLGYRVMEDLPLFGEPQEVYTYFEQVNGLTAGSYVYINGVKVGSVKNLRLTDKGRVRVALGFSEELMITKGSVAHLKSDGLLGGKSISIEMGSSNEKVPPGTVIEGIYSGGFMDTISKKGGRLASDASASLNKLNEILSQVEQIVGQKNEKKIGKLLGNLEQATAELASLMENKSQQLGQSIEHANDALANLDTLTTQNRAQIDSAIAGLSESMQNMEKITAELETTSNRLNSILGKIDEGQGSLGKLVNNPSLYNNMDSLSVELEKLLENVNEDPGKYLKHLRLIELF